MYPWLLGQLLIANMQGRVFEEIMNLLSSEEATNFDCWDQQIHNLLHELHCIVGKTPCSYGQNPKEQVVLTRCRIGHRRLTHSYLTRRIALASATKIELADGNRRESTCCRKTADDATISLSLEPSVYIVEYSDVNDLISAKCG
jgi:hypothetical protein